jgi:FixJ family two-component response regulator
LVTTPNKEPLAVWLLDDDPAILRATSRLLDSAGLKVESFSDPIAFLEQARVHRPPVVVIDIWMPAMNGLEVQTQLRRVSPSTRVIILTSRDDAAIRTIAMKAGASAFFVKGVQNKDFLAGIRSAGAET